ncbi:hypothetical protein IQ26_03813 [Mesorhizobium tianshanense]|uniref:Uncharacterized protein n=1 Tax=Mesorhizobium tianshanense TaxID=39844 RepID=A0A562NPD0_9HYPH|nr:hypothetical protein IQ26_03813 [Mesorhizobium tianshanense]
MQAGLVGLREGVMEFASCYVQDWTVLASSMFLTVTAAFMVLGAIAAARLIAMSGTRSVEQPQTA